MISKCDEKPIALLASYMFNGLRIFSNVEGHVKLTKVLKPFNTSGLLPARTSYLYLYKFLSCSFNTENRLHALTSHYKYFKNNFPYHSLRLIFSRGLFFWSETVENDLYEMRLINAFPYETEGILSCIFSINGTDIYTVSFTFCEGANFGLVDNQVIYISRIQGGKESLDAISKSTKCFSENAPHVLLMSAIEGMALGLGIKTIVGISNQNQIGYMSTGSSSFQKNYDDFWKTYESIKIGNGDYMVSLPIQYKGLSLKKSKHRNRSINKRKVRQEISRKVYLFFVNNVFSAKKIRFTPMRAVKEIKATA